MFLAFCYMLYDEFAKNPGKHVYYDECCIAPGELDSHDSNNGADVHEHRSESTNLNQTVIAIDDESSTIVTRRVKQLQNKIPVEQHTKMASIVRIEFESNPRTTAPR